MCDGADTPQSTQCGPRHSAGVVPAGVANISSTGFLNLSELCLITVCIRCSWRLEPITYARPPTDPCVCSPQLVEDLTTASKVVELVDASAHCQLQSDTEGTGPCACPCATCIHMYTCTHTSAFGTSACAVPCVLGIAINYCGHFELNLELNSL